MSASKVIQVFEHSFLPLSDVFKQHHITALSKLNALHNYKYFDLKHNGIVFKQFVGVIQIDTLIIEILPKIDRNENESIANKRKWQHALIHMLKATQKLNTQQIGEAHVSKQSIHLLDIYFDLFLNEVELLIHRGLIKQYDTELSNIKVLRGKIDFNKHIRKNLVHKERFYTTHAVYHKDHIIHQILGLALHIISELSKGSYRYSKCKKIEIDFPETKKIGVTEDVFDKVPQNRKTLPYQKALSIARLIILNYAPNIKSGSEQMLALLFDMNDLWEQYILNQLKKASRNKDIDVYGQSSKLFWHRITIRPDIILKKINSSSEETLVIDTKWKNIDQIKPSTHDLRQMYVYNKYWNSKKSLLLYPSHTTDLDKLEFIPFEGKDHSCGLGKLSIFDKDGNLNQNIGDVILQLL